MSPTRSLPLLARLHLDLVFRPVPLSRGPLDQARRITSGQPTPTAAAAVPSPQRHASRPTLVLVESPAKAKKIQQFLGADFQVLASYGHVRDLAQRPGSVDPAQDFSLLWEPSRRAAERLQQISEAVRGADRVVLATDPDREGEAIAWHLLQELQGRQVLEGRPCHRATFTEVTPAAVLSALQHPRELSQPLVDAYLARRALDYLFGFHLSPVLWRKIPVGARSAGRVQSAALRMICQREAAIETFVPQRYHTIEAAVQGAGGERIQARLTGVDGAPPPKPGFPDADLADSVAQRVQDASWTVADVAQRESSRNPPPPFTTSTLQQEANRRLGFGASLTMQLAQDLYEAGHITYMRTDGVSLEEAAVTAIQAQLQEQYGPHYVPRTPTQYKAKTKNAQEAHEAIRPTDIRLTAAALQGAGASPSTVKLYGLIRARTLACQATPARFEQVSAAFTSGDGTLALRSSASTLAFPGFLAAYQDGSAAVLDPDTAGEPSELAEGEGEGGSTSDSAAAAAAAAAVLHRLVPGDPVAVPSAAVSAHDTRPPGRYSEGGLVKALEEAGIGRPSTYASIIKLLQSRGYVRKEGRALVPEDRGRILASFLEAYFEQYVDYGFTARMEGQLDDVAGGEVPWRGVLSEFWAPFSQRTASLSDVPVRDVIDRLDATLGEQLFAAQQAQRGAHLVGDSSSSSSSSSSISSGTRSSSGSAGGGAGGAAGAHGGSLRACPACGTGRLGLKLSSRGKGGFIGCSRYPSCTYARSFAAVAGADDAEWAEGDGACEGGDGDSKAAGGGERGERDNPHLPPHLLRVRESRRLAEEMGISGGARVLGTDPASGMVVLVRSGLFGPYIQLGVDDDPSMKRIPLNKQINLKSMTLEKVEAFLCLPRDLGKHPQDGTPVIVGSGKFGPFVRWAGVSRSLPQELSPARVTLEQAVGLLEKKVGKRGKGKTQAGGARKEGAAAGAQQAKRRSKSKPGPAEDGEEQGQPSPEQGATPTAGAVPRQRTPLQMFLAARGGTAAPPARRAELRREWTTLTPEQQAPFERDSQQDKLRSKMQREGFLPLEVDWDGASQAQRAKWIQRWEQKGSKSNGSTPPKRPRSGYNIFFQEMTRLKKEGKEVGVSNIAGAWRELSAEQKMVYTLQSLEERKKYQLQKARYVRNMLKQ